MDPAVLMLFVFHFVIIAFLTRVAIIIPVQESRHAHDDVVIVIMVIQVYFLVGFRSVIRDGIEMLFRHYVDLVIRHDALKFLDLIDTTLANRYSGLSVLLLC